VRVYAQSHREWCRQRPAGSAAQAGQVCVARFRAVNVCSAVVSEMVKNIKQQCWQQADAVYLNARRAATDRAPRIVSDLCRFQRIQPARPIEKIEVPTMTAMPRDVVCCPACSSPNACPARHSTTEYSHGVFFFFFFFFFFFHFSVLVQENFTGSMARRRKRRWWHSMQW